MERTSLLRTPAIRGVANRSAWSRSGGGETCIYFNADLPTCPILVAGTAGTFPGRLAFLVLRRNLASWKPGSRTILLTWRASPPSAPRLIIRIDME